LFVRTKRGAFKVSRDLKQMGFRSAEIHSDRSLNQRTEALAGFKSGKYRILVATDIAARGIDVTGIELVVNYDIPEDSENYVHRIGRTARAGREGRAISFAMPDQREEVRNIEKLLKMALPVSSHAEFPQEQFMQGHVAKKPSFGGHGHHQPRSGQRGDRGGHGGGRKFQPRRRG
jgi:ATP-dependent RNA helicase RhlE